MWIRSTDWYPDDQLRLYDRRKAGWTGQYVHEALKVDGSLGRLGRFGGLAQHYIHAGELDQLERLLLDELATHHVDPEVLLRVRVLHHKVHVSHRDTELITLCELGLRGQGAEHCDGEHGQQLHKTHSIHDNLTSREET